MLFFKRRKQELPVAPPAILAPSVPEGCRVYAIGDVHGRIDLLDGVITGIENDLVRSPSSNVVTVLMGDYVDRGPAPAEVLDRLTEGALPGHVVALRGNHEDAMLRFLEEPQRVAEFWLKYGGLETLHAYGVDVRELKRSGDVGRAARELRKRLPKRHLDFLEKLPLTVTIGDYFFCHAGVKPGVPLTAQSPEDLMWIRDEFLDWPHSFGKVIVHGHTPVERPEVRANRINIDTGGYISNRLTCLVLGGTTQRFLRAQ